jgi:hypothetical protein
LRADSARRFLKTEIKTFDLIGLKFIGTGQAKLGDKPLRKLASFRNLSALDRQSLVINRFEIWLAS